MSASPARAPRTVAASASTALADVLTEIPGVQSQEAGQIGRGVAIARAVIVRMVQS